MLKRSLLFSAIVAILYSLGAADATATVALNPVDRFVVSHGYAGAQFVSNENTFRLPIQANGKIGDLTIDTGAPGTVIFRESVKKFGLTVEATDIAVHGAFGSGQEKLGRTNIQSLSMGNCTLKNVLAAVASAPDSGGWFRTYGSSDGLFGIREMFHFGAILDLNSHLLLVNPAGPQKNLVAGIRSVLTSEGYVPIEFTLVSGHLQVPATVNGASCKLILDTGAFLTALEPNFARTAKIGGYASETFARGFGTKARPVRVSKFPELKIGSFVIHNASVTITDLDPDLLGTGGGPHAAGLLGAEYLGMHGAVFDFNSSTLYLRSKSKD